MYAATPATARATAAVDARIARSTPPRRRGARREVIAVSVTLSPPGEGRDPARSQTPDSRRGGQGSVWRRSVSDMLFLQEDEEEPGSSWLLPYPGPMAAGMVTRWLS